MSKVHVIDYGTGNLANVVRALEHCGAEVTVSNSAEEIRKAERLVLPGVGAFEHGMKSLEALGLIEAIKAHADHKPFLGICLGMQMMLDSSEEFGNHPGLGIIPGKVVPIPADTRDGGTQKIPHIGWNALSPGRDWQGSLLQTTTDGDAVYFVHSYMAKPDDPAHRLAETQYGGHAICAVVASGHAYGCQFHPEKSARVGLNILEQFLAHPL